MAAAAILDCRIHKILLAGSVRRPQTHHCTKFHQNRSFHCGDIAILHIFKIAAAAILDFGNSEILLAIVVEGVQTHRHAKFRQNRSISCEDIKIFQFFKMAAAAIWDFRNREFLFAASICGAETHHCIKFPQNWSSILYKFIMSHLYADSKNQLRHYLNALTVNWYCLSVNAHLINLPFDTELYSNTIKVHGQFPE